MPATPLEPLRVGVLGLNFGLGYLQHHLGSDRQYLTFHGVCDQDPERLRAAGEALDCSGFTELDEMLGSSEIEVVAIFTGPYGRAGLIDRCLAAGKHVMTTKPLELDPAAIEASFVNAESLGLYVLLNSPSPVPGRDLRLVQQWQSEYDLGELVFANCDSWYQAREVADGSWYDDPALCPVAPILRLGVYGLNDLLSLGHSVQDMQATATCVRTGRPTPDAALLTLQLDNGAIATLRASWRCRPTRDVFVSEFVFENGVITRRVPAGADHWDRHPIQLHVVAQDEAGQIQEVNDQVEHRESNCAYRWDILQRLVRGQDVPGRISREQTLASVRVLAELKRRFTHVGAVGSA